MSQTTPVKPISKTSDIIIAIRIDKDGLPIAETAMAATDAAQILVNLGATFMYNAGYDKCLKENTSSNIIDPSTGNKAFNGH